MTTVSAFLNRLHDDQQFREKFAADPAGVLAEQGIDTSALALPEKIDASALAARLNSLSSGQGTAAASPASVSNLSAQDLWDRHGAIGFKEAGEQTVAVVVYGTAIAVAVVVGAAPNVMSVEQLMSLRALSRQQPHQLSFSVTGADGTKVDGLTKTALEAFLGRLQ